MTELIEIFEFALSGSIFQHGRGKSGQPLPRKVEIHLAAFGDFDACFQRVGQKGEALCHLGGRGQIGHIVDGEVSGFARRAQKKVVLHGNQRIAQMALLRRGVVDVVGGDDGQAHLKGDLEHRLVQHPLVGQKVILQFDKKLLRTKDLAQGRQLGAGRGVILFPQRRRHRTPITAGQRDEAVGVFGQQIPR